MTQGQQGAIPCALDLAHDLAAIRARASAAADDLSGLDLELALELVDHLDLAQGLAHGIALDLNQGLTVNLDRVHGLASALDRAHGSASPLDIDRALYVTHGLASDLDRARGSADDLLHAVQEAGRKEVVPLHARSQGLALSACRLATLATRLLPAGNRARYGEEYRSELHDLAAEGAKRPQQLGYAVRLLVRAAPLRVAVLAPRRGKASS
jgi:hypothetical protein